MKEDMKNLMNEIKSVIHDDEYIPARFSFWNLAALGCSLFMPSVVVAKKVYLTAAMMGLEALSCFQMNQEMSRFMNVVINGESNCRRKL